MKIPQAKKYITDFEQMGLGMFVHWGLYSQIGKGEWVYALDNMKMTDYERLKDTFTAENFDAEQLVLTAKNAGCKYITGDIGLPASDAYANEINYFTDCVINNTVGEVRRVRNGY